MTRTITGPTSRSTFGSRFNLGSNNRWICRLHLPTLFDILLSASLVRREQEGISPKLHFYFPLLQLFTVFLQGLCLCMDFQFDTVVRDRPIILSKLLLLHFLKKDIPALSWEFFVNRFETLSLEAQLHLDCNKEFPFPTSKSVSVLLCHCILNNMLGSYSVTTFLIYRVVKNVGGWCLRIMCVDLVCC